MMIMAEKRESIDKLKSHIQSLADTMDKMRLAEYVEYLNNTKRLLIVNFIGGLFRGFGMAIGFSILGAVFIYILRRLVMMNLPIIGDFIAEIVKLVQRHL